MSAATTADREKEGGGVASQRRRTAAPGLSHTYAILNSDRSTSEIRVAFMRLPTHEIGNWRSTRRRVGSLPSTKKRRYSEPICCTVVAK